MRPRGYPNFQWIQCYQGEGELILEGQRYRVKAQQGMLLYPEIPHEYYAVKEPWEVDWIDFSGYQIEHLLKMIGLYKSEVLMIANSEMLLSKMRKAVGILKSDSLLKGPDCSIIIYEILMDLLKFASRSSDESIQEQHQRLRPVFEYITQHYPRVITLEDLAGIIHVTPEHFCLLFKKTMKMRPFEYLNNVRINKSKDMIVKDSSMRIGEIAAAVGYDNTSYFCSMFKKMEGMSPGKFRKLHGI